MSKLYFIGVDVGTSSVRASVIDETGKICSTHTNPINIWNPCTDFYQQSSENIWESVVGTVTKSISEAQVLPENINGIGFDATCSTVVLDEHFQPVSISPNGEQNENVILWMDHRAKQEVEIINSTGHKVLDSVGGIMSVEMQPPKLMWLKKNLPQAWSKMKHFFDLPDFLSWRATDSLTRGMCSVVCKWTYLAQDETQMCWDESFFRLIGLEDLAEDGFSKIGQKVQAPGSPCGSGLSQRAAREFGLRPGTPVGTSLIDAHAGALGCLGCCPADMKKLPNLENRLVVIAGTSTCHIVCSQKPVPVPGVWGPFLSAVVPGMWVTEGGQSSSGSLLDFVTSNHAAYAAVKKKATERGVHVFDHLNEIIDKLAATLGKPAACITENLHMWPDFHGNRSPLADPNLCGMVTGLKLSATEDDLALLYLAAVQALAYGTRHIVSEMEKHGHQISLVYLCGGLRKNKLYVQTHSDVLDEVSLKDVMTAMGGGGKCLQPDASVSRFHEKKYTVFLQMLKDQLKYKSLMAS